MEPRAVSRRDFLKMAGIAGVVVGAGAGLGGLLSACGDDATSTTTAAGSATTAAPTTTGGAEAVVTTVAAPTTVTAAAETGEEVVVGFVSPLTGPLASFGIPDKYVLSRWEEAIGDGLVSGDGKKHPVKFEMQDTQSDSNRAAQVAGDLIQNAQIDMMVVASTPDTVTPTVEQCEANGVPVVSTDCPWQTFLGQNMETGYNWAYHAAFGGEDGMAVNLDLLGRLPSNKKVGLMFDNSADGNMFAEMYPPIFESAGYEPIDGGRFQPGSEDYTAQIAEFKKSGCELVCGNMNPPDFTNFWKQVAQQGLNPKAVVVNKACLFPQSAEALGEIGNGIMTELWWHPTFPWKSSLTGESCQQLADHFEATTEQQWTAPLLHYCIGEMAVYAIKNASDPKNKEALLAAVTGMKFDSIVGPIDFTAPLSDPMIPGPGHKTKNVYDHGLGGAQWLMLGGKWIFDQVVTSKVGAPFILDETVKEPQPLKW
jgi:branched-chain amino acid transport system substrate-binding protein